MLPRGLCMHVRLGPNIVWVSCVVYIKYISYIYHWIGIGAVANLLKDTLHVNGDSKKQKGTVDRMCNTLLKSATVIVELGHQVGVEVSPSHLDVINNSKKIGASLVSGPNQGIAPSGPQRTHTHCTIAWFSNLAISTLPAHNLPVFNLLTRSNATRTDETRWCSHKGD